jgi:hypothetical protein
LNPEANNVLFRETQWFQPRRLWAIVITTAVVAWICAFHHAWRKSGITDLGFALFLVVVGIAAPVFLILYRQTTEVRNDGIYLKRTPFSHMNDVIRFSDFVRYQPRTCSAIYSAGGWGIAEGWKGKAYNMGGKQGLELLLVNGGRVLIGTCKMRQLLDALHAQCGTRHHRPGVTVNS